MFRDQFKPPALTLAAKCIAPDVTACSQHRAAVAVARWRADISPESAVFAQVWSYEHRAWGLVYAWHLNVALEFPHAPWDDLWLKSDMFALDKMLPPS